MKGSLKVVETLNRLLVDELTAISQYMVHAGMCANWGYEKLHDAIEKRAIDEMRHAEHLIDRILFLEGLPTVSNLNKMMIGDQIDTQLRNDHEAEVGAIKGYNVAIRLAVEESDNGTRELLEATLKDEERHIDWLEAQLDQISHMGLGAYLSEQIS
jgi:bacterioferritin